MKGTLKVSKTLESDLEGYKILQGFNILQNN